MTDAQQKKIVELYKSGISVSEIVKKIKVSKASVYRIIKDPFSRRYFFIARARKKT